VGQNPDKPKQKSAFLTVPTAHPPVPIFHRPTAGKAQSRYCILLTWMARITYWYHAAILTKMKYVDRLVGQD
jgi:hypothetical protein